MNNVIRIGFILIANKLSDLLLSAKTTLPTLASAAGAPAWVAPLLVPIRESGALLPQMAYAYILRKQKRRDTAWQISMLLQFISGVLLIGLGLNLEGELAGFAIIVSLTCMSLARAMCSLTMKDIQGQHVKKGSRGRLLGSASTFSSLISITVAVFALLGSSKMSSSQLTVIASIALLSNLWCMWLMRPLRTCVETEHREVKNGLYVDKQLTKFVIVRALLAHTALIAPVFVMLYAGDLSYSLAYLIIAQGLANFLSSYLWGWLSDESALWCMRTGAFIVILAALMLLVLPLYYEEINGETFFIVGLFFILGIGHQGVRTGRKIYGVDIATEQHRTEFIATSNTLVGLAILAFGIIYSALTVVSHELSLMVMMGGISLGILGSFLLKTEK
jgi:hypothetical protein